jgi:hypothetical protein
MGKALGEMFKSIPKAVMAVIIENSAGDIRSAINCANLVAMQLHYNPRVKDVSMLDLLGTPLIVDWEGWIFGRGDWIYFTRLVGLCITNVFSQKAMVDDRIG